MRRITLAASAGFLLLAAAVVAQPPAPVGQAPMGQAAMPGPEKLVIARACAGDIDRLCHGVAPGQGRIKACMRSHFRDLSPGCFDALLHAIAAEREPE